MKLKRLDYYQFNKILNERLNLFEWTCKEYDVTYGIENDKNRFELIVDSDRVDGSNGSHRIHTVEDILFHIKDFDDTYWVYADEQTCREAQIALKKLEDKYNKKYSEIEFDNFLCDEIRKANPYRRIKITPVCLDDRTYLSNIHK